MNVREPAVCWQFLHAYRQSKKAKPSATATIITCLSSSGDYIRASADDGLERQRVVLDADLDLSAQARSVERHIELGEI